MVEKVFPMSVACQCDCFNYPEDMTFFYMISCGFLCIGDSYNFLTELHFK